MFTAKDTQTFAANKVIEWKFNISGAPWWGGIWERLVGSVKRCIKVVGVRKIGYIELHTLLLEIECILNNRPLCADYDSEVDDVLTPSHLLYGRRLETVNFERKDDVNINEYSIELNKREKRLSIFIEHFWKIWRKQYVLLLRQFLKCTALEKEPKVKVNDIVMIYDEKLPRQLLKMGLILCLIVGPDDIIRGAKVRCWLYVCNTKKIFD